MEMTKSIEMLLIDVDNDVVNYEIFYDHSRFRLNPKEGPSWSKCCLLGGCNAS